MVRRPHGLARNRGLQLPEVFRSPSALVLGVAGIALIAWATLSPGKPSTSNNRPLPAASTAFRGGEGGELPPPHGRKTLVDLLSRGANADALKQEAGSMEQWGLSLRQECDFELLVTGGFTPLEGFLTEAQYNSVVRDMRLSPDGAVWPMPITLDVSEAFAEKVAVGGSVGLRDRFYNLVGVLRVESKWTPDKRVEAQHVFGTTDESHPGVAYLMQEAGPVYLGGRVEALATPHHYDFTSLRRTPAQLREEAQRLGWGRFVAFQTRNPMHRAHIELTRLAGKSVGAGVVIHPVVGMTKPGDVEYQVRVRCYQAIIDSGRYYPEGGVLLSLLPLAMRMAGPREALWHAIVRKNHGATHFIVGRDHAGVKSALGKDFYGAYDAQELVSKHAEEIGITMVKFQKVAYVVAQDRYLPQDEVPEGAETKSISGTQFRAMMASGEEIPTWFSDPDVIKILRQVSPPLPQRGFVVFFSGLSGSGKSTVAAALAETLRALLPSRPVTMLDGDVVRTHLSKELGFSVDDRNTNIARIGWVAARVAREGGIAVAPTIAPFESSRAAARSDGQASGGGFVLVHVSTSLATCVARDTKGLYRKAETQGLAVTGFSHPYEHPEHAELTIDGGEVPVDESVRYIVGWLVHKGYITHEQAPSFTGVFPPSAKSDTPTAAELGRVGVDTVLTEGFTDRIATLCKPTDSPVLLLAVGANPDVVEAAAAALEKGAATAGKVEVASIATADVVKAERRAALKHVKDTQRCASDSEAAEEANKLVPVVSSDWGHLRHDSGWAVGGLASDSNGLPSGPALEAAWDVLQVTKNSGDNAGAAGRRVRVVRGPRLVRHMRAMLRMHPCMRVVGAVATGSAVDQTVSDLVASGGDSAAAERYVQGVTEALNDAKARFSSRVWLVETEEEAVDAAQSVVASLSQA